jgi:hypothetical protein
MALKVEDLPSEHKALSSNSDTAKKKKRQCLITIFNLIMLIYLFGEDPVFFSLGKLVHVF